MNAKTKSIIRACIYFILFSLLLVCFIFLSNKYSDNGKSIIKTYHDYYEKIDSEKYEVVNGSKTKKLIKEGMNIIFIGNSKTKWSQQYAEYLNDVIKEYKDIKINYYDLENDKALLNSNYYDIIDLLDGSLVTTDSTENGLFAPCLYIIKDGKVLYYNVETVAMKNTDSVENYWTEVRTANFKQEIAEAINKYYLNNK